MILFITSTSMGWWEFSLGVLLFFLLFHPVSWVTLGWLAYALASLFLWGTIP